MRRSIAVWSVTFMPETLCEMVGVDIFHGAQHALAEILGFVAVAQFEGFVLAGGSAGGNRRAPAVAIVQNDVSFDGGIAARIENLAAYDASNFCGHAPSRANLPRGIVTCGSLLKNPFKVSFRGAERRRLSLFYASSKERFLASLGMTIQNSLSTNCLCGFPEIDAKKPSLRG